MLQCHPYPHEYADPSRQCAHCAFFMGLSRKEGVKIQEGQQFDIRGTVDEFRHDINLYMFWKPGMELAVSHVRRKQIPAYVFPEGYKRPRLSRHVNHQSDKNDTEDGTANRSPDSQLKRKHDSVGTDDIEPSRSAKRSSVSPVHPKNSPQSGSTGDETRCNNQIKRAPSDASGGSPASPQASERSPDTIVSAPRCTTTGAVCYGDAVSKHVPLVENCTTPTVAVCTTLKRVAEKVVSELVGSERLGSNNSSELLESMENDVLSENVRFGGNGVTQGGLPEELEVMLLVHTAPVFVLSNMI